MYCDTVLISHFSQSCTVDKSRKFWQATGQSNLAYWMEDCSIGWSAVVWVRKPNFGSFCCGQPFVDQVWLSGGPPEFLTFSYCTWLRNLRITISMKQSIGKASLMIILLHSTFVHMWRKPSTCSEFAQPANQNPKSTSKKLKACMPLCTSWIPTKMCLPCLITIQSCSFDYRIDNLFAYSHCVICVSCSVHMISTYYVCKGSWAFIS